MFAKIFIKEWRENILIFSLTILMMAVMVFLSLTGREEMTLYSSGMFLLLFLPLAALLLGSGGFYTEYKDNAWVYLFSRPIKKEVLWIFKFISQLSILIAVLVIFYFIRRFLPGLDNILQDLDFPTAQLRFFSLSIYAVMPLMAFTVAFSLSLLYEKQFIIFFASILVGVGLLIVIQGVINFLWIKGYYVWNHEIFYLFFPISFILASVLTIIKSDFSQLRNKILRFSKYLVIFLIFSFLFSTIWVTNGQIFLPYKDFYSWTSQEYKGGLYFQAFRQGIFRYDSTQDNNERLSKEAKISFEKFSLRANKIAFYKEILLGKFWYHDLWIMNADGTEKKPLVESHKIESPFHNRQMGSCILSSDGEKVAFVTTHEENEEKKRVRIQTLWWANTDGTGLKSQILDVPKWKTAKLIAWPPGKNYIILLMEQKPPSSAQSDKIVKIDIEGESHQILVENFKTPRHWKVSLKQNFLLLRMRRFDENKDILAVLDLNTFEMSEILSSDKLRIWGMKWSPDSQMIAFSSAKDVCVYSFKDMKFEIVSQGNYERGVGFDWTSDGQKFLLLAPVDGDYHLIVMDKKFQEEKKIKIPVKFKDGNLVWGLENRALLKGFGRGPFWRVDLETEEWKKVY